MRSSVVLPAPLAPSTAVIVPGRAEIETPSSTGTPPYPATMPSTASARCPACSCPSRPGQSCPPPRPARLPLRRARSPGRRSARPGPCPVFWARSPRRRGTRRSPPDRPAPPRRAGRDQLAEVQHEDRVADRHHQVHPVLDDHHAGIVGQLLDQLAELGQLASRAGRWRARRAAAAAAARPGRGPAPPACAGRRPAVSGMRSARSPAPTRSSAGMRLLPQPPLVPVRPGQAEQRRTRTRPRRRGSRRP